MQQDSQRIIVLRKGLSPKERDNAFRHELVAILGIDGIGLDTEQETEHPLVHQMAEEDGKHRVGLTSREPGNSLSLSTSESSPSNKPGGIDFRALPIVTQKVPGMPTGVMTPQILKLNMDLENELRQIEHMLSTGIIPSSQRIKEYILASCQSQEGSQYLEKVLTCIADIFRLEEERSCESEPVLKQMLVLLEKDAPAQELQKALVNVNVEEK
ncbi:MAG: hypothetical protein NC923_01960 [Candidatus Omnitrophica bacterium]|nr:hypothetical protein [Candidatus Omnitrophota bacterium]